MKTVVVSVRIDARILSLLAQEYEKRGVLLKSRSDLASQALLDLTVSLIPDYIERLTALTTAEAITDLEHRFTTIRVAPNAFMKSVKAELGASEQNVTAPATSSRAEDILSLMNELGTKEQADE